ncbi:hypothetical protein JCM11251_004214 [Rhodosporidiobolus azoricus]
MHLPLPNEVLTDIFGNLQDSVATLKTLCLVSRGFAHVARPFLYTYLPLPFLRIRHRDRPGSALALDPTAYARFLAVTSDEASVSLTRAVKVVMMSGGARRVGRRDYPERLDWTPHVLGALVKRCENLHTLKLDNPLGDEIGDALGALPSNPPRLTHLVLAATPTPVTLDTLVGGHTALTSLYLTIPSTTASLSLLLDLPSLPSLVDLTLVVQHPGRKFRFSSAQLTPEFLDRAILPRMKRLGVFFVCKYRRRRSCCEFWWGSMFGGGGPQLEMIGALPSLCREVGVVLYVDGRMVQSMEE